MNKFKSKAPSDPKGSHIRVYATIHNSFAWSVLSPSAKALWLDMRTQIGSTKNGVANATLELLRHRGWVSRHTIAHARDELIALGFIELTRQGHICSGGKTPNLYRFTDERVYEQPKVGMQSIEADSLFLKYKTKSDALAKVKELKYLRTAKRKSVQEKRKRILDGEAR